MASSGVLIVDVAAAFALPVGTINTFMLRLRENEMIHSSGRGTSAEPMQTSDAATLLAAMLAGETISEAPAAAKTALAMPKIGCDFDSSAATSPDWATNVVKRISRQDEAHTKTFGDALERLIFSAERFCRSPRVHSSAWELMFKDVEKQANQPTAEIENKVRIDHGWTHPQLRVTYCLPARLAFIDLRLGYNVLRRFVFGDHAIDDFNQLRGEPLLVSAGLNPGGFSTARQIDGRQILAVARSLQKPIDTTRNRHPKK